MNRSFWHHKPADRNRYLSFRVKLIEETDLNMFTRIVLQTH